MPKCTNCRANKGYSSVACTCVVCGKDGCRKCLTYVATVELRDSRHNREAEDIWVCSDTCYQRFKKDFGTEEKEVLIDLKKLLEVLRYS